MSEWKRRTLISVIDEYGGVIQTGPFGSQLHEYEYVQSGVPVVMPKDIRNGAINHSSIAHITFEKANQLLRHVLSIGDIVFPRRGDVGKCAYITNKDEGCLCGTGCLKIVVPQNALNSRFLFYFLLLPETTSRLETNSTGATMINLNADTLGRLELPFPPLPIQRRIADILSAYDDLIENNRRRIEILEETARTLYRKMFVVGECADWKKCRLSDVVEVLSGGTPSTKNDEFWNGGIPFFGPSDITGFAYTYDTAKYISEAGVKARRLTLYPKDTVFITARGTVGKINLIQRPMAMNQSCFALRAIEPLSQFFLYYALVDKSPEQFRGVAKGSVFEAIGTSEFSCISFCVPPTDLISAFTCSVTPMLDQMAALSNQNRALAAARDLLLPRLMKGEKEL